jgi:hypothetical protein
MHSTYYWSPPLYSLQSKARMATTGSKGRPVQHTHTVLTTGPLLCTASSCRPGWRQQEARADLYNTHTQYLLLVPSSVQPPVVDQDGDNREQGQTCTTHTVLTTGPLLCTASSRRPGWRQQGARADLYNTHTGICIWQVDQ